MVAASRSGSTCAVMLLSSPSASTFSNQASRSLLLGLRDNAPASIGSARRPAAPAVTLMSMERLRLFFAARPQFVGWPTARLLRPIHAGKTCPRHRPGIALHEAAHAGTERGQRFCHPTA